MQQSKLKIDPTLAALLDYVIASSSFADWRLYRETHNREWHTMIPNPTIGSCDLSKFGQIYLLINIPRDIQFAHTFVVYSGHSYSWFLESTSSYQLVASIPQTENKCVHALRSPKISVCPKHFGKLVIPGCLNQIDLMSGRNCKKTVGLRMTLIFIQGEQVCFSGITSSEFSKNDFLLIITLR